MNIEGGKLNVIGMEKEENRKNVDGVKVKEGNNKIKKK